MMPKRKTWLGFSLLEMLIVLVIFGVVASIAIPSYQRYLREGRRMIGKDCLQQVHHRMESFFASRNTYPTSMGGLGYTNLSGGALDCDDQGYYLVTIGGASSGCPAGRCYQLLATAQPVQEPDGNLRLTFRADKTNPAERIVRERMVDGTWQQKWD